MRFPLTPEFDAAQGALNEALDALFAHAERELAGLADQAREAKALRSLVNHRDGLSVFVDRAQVPMDNNLAERVLRGPVIGRRLSFGSNSENGARFTAVMYSVIATLSLNGIDVLRWLEAWLRARANSRCTRRADSPWRPTSMRMGAVAGWAKACSRLEPRRAVRRRHRQSRRQQLPPSAYGDRASR